MNFSHLSVITFILTSFIGLYLLKYILKGKETRKGLALIHGLVAVIAFTLVFYHYWATGANSYFVPVLLFFLAAGGGVGMMLWDLSGHRVPRWLGLLHGALAVSGLITLIVLV